MILHEIICNTIITSKKPFFPQQYCVHLYTAMKGLIIRSKLNCRHKSLTFQLELSFRISRLKSPVIKILEILVSKASPIESSIDDKMAFVKLGGL